MGLNVLTQKKYFFYLYHFNEFGEHVADFWSTQAVLPSDIILQSTAGAGFIQLQNGFYVWRKANVASGVAVALIPVKWSYVITNEYLKNTFVVGEEIETNYDISLESGTATVKNVNGNLLFYLFKK